VTTYRIRAIRLINFHNFVDERIEVRDGGHLFLLGDNGSGKTTVLDAVHLVLAGGEPELNAAARVGARREEGRTLQGIVLRFDRELGEIRNTGGAIAYAAIELVDATGGRIVTLGIGAEATTMEAKVSKWGFIVARPMAEVPLVDDARCPRDRDALRRQLGANHVHATLAAYRKDLARRLFGSDAQYDEAVRFWAMAKAYREIVAGARDFGALFERLLPAPDGGVFAEILKTLRAVDDLELALRDLEGQRLYVAGVADRVRDVAVAREAAARYRWLACHRERDEALADAARADEAAATAQREAERQRLEAERARLRSEEADEVLRRATAEDTAGVLTMVRDAEARRRLLAIDVEQATAAVDECQRAERRASEVASAAQRELADRARVASAAVRASIADVAELPGELRAAARLADELDQLASPTDDAPLPDASTAAAEAAAIRTVRDQALVEARVLEREVSSRHAARTAAVRALEDAGEAVTLSVGWVAARRALTDAGIAARPLYELLEPVTDAEPATLAAIESLAGDAVMTALVVAPDDRPRARALIAAAAPGIRVVVETHELGLPPWCAAALAPGRGIGPSVLAAALAQPDVHGEVAPPVDGDVTLRGLGHRVEHSLPRWLGTEARRRAHEQQLAAASSARGGSEPVLAAATPARERAGAAVDRAVALGRSITAADTSMSGVWYASANARHRAHLTTAARDDADRRLAAPVARLGELDGELEALRARVAGVDLAQLERRLATLRQQADRARARWHEHLTAQATAVAQAREATTRGDEARTRATDLTRSLGELSDRLRGALATVGSASFAGDDGALEHHVRVTQRGDSFRSLAAIQQRVVEAERDSDVAVAELEGDGSRGVRHLIHAGRFGFGYDRVRNHVEDRRGQPLPGVLAELERAIDEQRSVVNDKTRALMDVLVMGELARHLQHQVHHLHETVKGINQVLRGLRFGSTEYQFDVKPRADRAELLDLVRRLSILDEDSRQRFRAWIDARLDELRAAGDDVPALLDYRRWFDFKLRMSTTRAEGVELTERLRVIGSGGEQGVPNYLLVLSLAKLMFDAAGATLRPLLFDEAFYGIDAGRRDQLLRVATDLGLQLLVASPDQDGATAAVRHATTLFVLKDDDHDVHLAPYHYWNHAHGGQPDLFTAPSDPAAAECRTT
jgi:energy-coupling factor transporter ATP-binding protein EcfA2